MIEVPEVYIDGLIRQRWDSTARKVYTYDTSGAVVGTRDYTPEENAAAAAAVLAATRETNRTALRADVKGNIDALLASVDAVNLITAASKSTINADPAAYIKDLARELRSVARQTVRIARVLTDSVDTANVGT